MIQLYHHTILVTGYMFPKFHSGILVYKFPVLGNMYVSEAKKAQIPVTIPLKVSTSPKLIISETCSLSPELVA